MLTQSFRAFRHWFVQSQEDKFLNGCNSGELMDSMVRRREFKTALDAPTETSSLMCRMAAKRGLRPDVVAKDSRRALLMAGACSRCRQRTLCKRWLDGRANKTLVERFCPNAHHFDDLKKRSGNTPDLRPSFESEIKLERRLK